MKKPIRLAAAVVAVAVGGFVLWTQTRPSRVEQNTKTVATTVSPVLASGTVSSATAPSKEDIPTDPRAALIQFGGTERFVTPNARGEFPRVPVPASAAITAAAAEKGVKPNLLMLT